jgi:hypothetical protein
MKLKEDGEADSKGQAFKASVRMSVRREYVVVARHDCTYFFARHQPLPTPKFHPDNILNLRVYIPSSSRRDTGTRKIHSPAVKPPKAKLA